MGASLGTRAATSTLVAAALVAAAGCGEAGPAARSSTRTLNIYATANLRSYGDAVRAEQRAVEDAGGRAGRFAINVIVRDEASRDTDNADLEQVRRNAEEAARDPDAIAYVGDTNSGSTATSAPILNRAGLLQVTPVSTYVGLTRPDGAAPGEPEKFHPTGRRTLARVIPADHVQARAGVIYAREVGVTRLGVVADETLYGQGLAQLVLSAARELGFDTIDGRGPGTLAEQARKATAAGADAVYFAACGPAGDMLDLAVGHPGKVFTGDCYSRDLYPRVPQLNDRFFVTTPGGGLEQTPAGRRWFERWREHVGTTPDDKLMFSYEAMSAILAAVERAGDDGDDRAAVVREFFATRDRDSVVGRYSIDAYGDTTLRSYGGFSYRDGRLRFDRVLDTGG